MTPEQITEQLRALHTAQVSPDSLAVVRARVFRAIDRKIPAEVEPVTWKTSIPTSMVYWGSGMVAMALVAVFVVGNLLPRHNAYHDTITAVVTGESITNSLAQAVDPRPHLTEARLAMKKSEHAMMGLDLDGEFAAYTQKQCLDAHMLYHAFLSHLDAVIALKQTQTTDPELLATYAELRMEIHAKDQVLEHRLTLYK